MFSIIGIVIGLSVLDCGIMIITNATKDDDPQGLGLIAMALFIFLMVYHVYTTGKE